MGRFLRIAGASALGFLAVLCWILCLSAMQVWLEEGWDGGDVALFTVVFLVAISSTAGAVTLAFKKPKART